MQFLIDAHLPKSLGQFFKRSWGHSYIWTSKRKWLYWKGYSCL